MTPTFMLRSKLHILHLGWKNIAVLSDVHFITKSEMFNDHLSAGIIHIDMQVIYSRSMKLATLLENT